MMVSALPTTASIRFLRESRGRLVVSLNHWGRVTHIYVRKLTMISSYNGLSPGRHRAIFWANAGIKLIGHISTNTNGISHSCILVQENQFETDVWKIAVILFCLNVLTVCMILCRVLCLRELFERCLGYSQQGVMDIQWNYASNILMLNSCRFKNNKLVRRLCFLLSIICMCML